MHRWYLLLLLFLPYFSGAQCPVLSGAYSLEDLSTEKMDSLAMELDSQIVHFPNCEYLYKDLLNVLYAQDKQEECEELLWKTIAQFPTSPEPYFNYAKWWYYEHDGTDTSLFLAEKAYGLQKEKDPRISLFLADLHMERYEDQKALTYYREVMLLFPEEVDGWLGAARIFLLGDDLDAGRAMADSALNRDPESEEGWLMLGESLERKMDTEEAWYTYSDGILHLPNSALLHYRKGILAADKESNDSARYYYRKAFALDSTLWEASYGQATIDILEEQYESAILILEKIALQKPEEPDVWYSLGFAKSKTGKQREALDAYSNCLKYHVDEDALYNRALVYDELEEDHLALKDLNEYLKINPSDTDALVLRCLVNIDLKRFEDACIDCEQAKFLGHTNVPKKVLKFCKKQ